MSRLTLLAIVGACVAAITTVTAHPALIRSHPSEGETLKMPPKVLQLWFSEMPSEAVSLITLSDAKGTAVEIGKTVVNKDKSMSADVPKALAAGEYTLTYRTSGDDGHTLRGSVKFSVAGTNR